ncbi:unnamed protein product [Ostreobium quekettii]|uniref:Patatin n=1 Tax=Ostreobium quekettii TaxID=121088 RepID=A0A8S1IRH2_9CHLO|nr:unnamed protein product [Ostreobium quekettii]
MTLPDGQADLPIGGIMGTSSGAYAGSLYCAGYTPEQIATELCVVPPVLLLRPCWRFWCGLLSLHVVVDRLRELLPPTFEDLDRKFAVGVIDSNGQHRLIDSGPLPEAVAASGAIPVLFAPVDVPGVEDGPHGDGGMRDRLGLVPWREHRRASLPSKAPDALVHLISRSSPFSGKDDVEAMGERRVSVARSQKSGVNFFTMGDYERQMRDACDQAAPLVQAVKDRISEPRKRLVA